MQQRTLRALVQATALTAFVTPSLAQEDSSRSNGLEEIVVTAQKRAESVRDTPLAITATSGEALLSRNITSLQDLTNITPNVNISSAQGTAHITIRGIGIGSTQPGAEGNVAVHVDGAYVSRPQSTLNAFYDVERLEVVRGPQGTLYGRNSTAGAINIITRDPTDNFTGFGQVTVGNYELITTEAGVGGPIAPGVSARIAFQTQDRGGYGWQQFPAGLPSIPNGAPGGAGSGVPATVTQGFKTDLDDLKTRAVRGKLKFDLSEDLSVLLAGEYFYQKDHSGIFMIAGAGPSGAPAVETLFGGVLAPNPRRNSYTQFPQGTRKEDYSFTGTINWDVSPAFSLTSITAYRNTDYSHTWNQGGTQLSFFQYSDSETGKQISEELRASGRIGNFSYVVGGFLYHEKQNVVALSAINNLAFAFPPASGFLSQGYGTSLRLETDARALFGQLSYELTDTIGIDAGIRYNWERKKKPFETFGYSLCTPYDPASVAWDTGGSCDINLMIGPREVTQDSIKPKVTLRFKPNNDTLAYLTFSQGFRSGGFNFGSGVDAAPYKPEELTDIEGGIKTTLLDRRLQIDLSAFYYKYKNLQVSRLNDAGNGVITESAGKATLYGLEAAIVALPTDRLKLDLQMGLLRSRYDEFSSANTSLLGISCVATAPALCGTTDPAVNALDGVIQDLSGNRLTKAPEYTISAGAEYTVNSNIGDFTLRGQMSMIGKVYFTAFNESVLSQGAYELFDASLRWEHPNQQIYANLFIKNISNKDYVVFATNNGQSPGARQTLNLGPPRTFGASVGVRW